MKLLANILPLIRRSNHSGERSQDQRSRDGKLQRLTGSRVPVLASFFMGLCLFASPAWGQVVVTAATGGTNISADKAANATSPAWTTLGNIVISENGNNASFAVGTNVTLILTAPAGWQFNSAETVTATVTLGSGGGSPNVAVNSVSVATSTITLNLTVSATNKYDILTISGVQVGATNGAALPSSGNILRTAGNPGTATINGIVNGTTNFGSLSQIVGAANKLTIATQPSATATAGQAFAPQPAINIADQFGNVLTAANGNADNSSVVTAARNLGNGLLQGTVTATASDGVATYTNLSHNVANTINITFSSGTLTSVTSNNITVNPAAASKVVFIQQPSNAGTGAIITPAMTVQLRDQYDNNVLTSGVSVAMTLSSGTGTLSGTTTRLTGSTGIATFDDLSINLEGSKQLTASSSGLTSAVSNSFSIIQTVTPTKVVFVQQPTTTTAGQAISPAITVQLKDAVDANAPVSGVSITLTLTTGTGTLSGTVTQVTNSGGLATFNDLSINLSGSKNLTALSSGLTSDVSASFTINPAAASQVAFVQQPTNTVAGATISPAPTVQLRDAFGNDVPTSGVSVTMTIASGTGALSGTTAQLTNASGLATFNDLSIGAAGSKSLQASSTGLTPDISATFDITTGAFTKLQLLMPGETAAPGTPSGKTGTPTAQVAGTSFNVTVNAVDANWNLVNTVTDEVGITSSDSYATLPANANLVAGTKIFSVTFKTAGSATVTSTDLSDGGKTPNTSPSVTVTPGAFVKLQLLVPGETAVPGSPSGKSGTPTAQQTTVQFQITVNAVDANWNLVNTITDLVGITSSDGAATLPPNANLVSGTRNFNFTFGTSGSQTITASDLTDPGKTANTSPSITVNEAGSIMSTSTGGNWNDPATWIGSTVPRNNAHVVIATIGGNAVTINANTASIRSVTINSGAILQGGGAFTLTVGWNNQTSFTNNGTFNANAVAVVLSATTTWTGGGEYNLNTLDLGSNKTLTLAAGVTLKLAGAGNPILNPGTLVPGTSSTIEYNGTSAQIITSSTTINFNSLKITNSAGVTLQKNLTATNLTGNLTITSGGLLNSSDGTTAFSITGAGGATLSVGANSALNLGSTATTASAFPTGFGTTTLDPSGTVQYSNSSSTTQTVSLSPTYGNLLFSGSGTKSIGAGTLTLAGNWTNNSTGGSLSTGTSTVLMTGTGRTIGGSAPTSFATLNINGTVTNSATITIGSDLGGTGTLTQGTSSTLNVNFGGAIGLSGLAASASGNTVNYQFGGAQTVKLANYANLVFGGSGVKTFVAGTTGVAEALTFGGTATADATTNSPTVDYNGGGNQSIAVMNYHNLMLSNAGTKSFLGGTTRIASVLSVSGGATANATANLSTIEFNGSSLQSFPVITYNNLTLSGAGAKSAAGNTTVNNNFTNSGSTSMGTFTLSITGTRTNTGTMQFAGAANGLTFAGGTVEYNGTTVTQTIANGTYNHLVLGGTAAKTTGGDLTVSGNFTNSVTTSMETFTLAITGTKTNTGTMQFAGASNGVVFAGGTVEYNGTVAQTVTDGTYQNLLFTNSGVKTITAATTATGTLTVNAGASLTVNPAIILQVNGDFTLAGTVTNNGIINVGN